jgi:serine/threonine-protein kinase
LLAFTENRPGTGWDIMILPMEGSEASGWKPGKPTVFLEGPFTEDSPVFSPDGRWLAYESNESGTVEVYVRPFPGPGGKQQISIAGGYPTWSQANKEIFYKGPDQKIWVVTYKSDGNSFSAEKPRLWSPESVADRGIRNRTFDLHPDGRRLAILTNPQLHSGTNLDKAIFVLNFFDEVRRLAPRP